MVINIINNTQEFTSLNVGDLFIYDGNVFIKTSTVFVRDFDEVDYNCVCLKTGYHHYFEPDKKVTEVKGELNVRIDYYE